MNGSYANTPAATIAAAAVTNTKRMEALDTQPQQPRHHRRLPRAGVIALLLIAIIVALIPFAQYAHEAGFIETLGSVFGAQATSAPAGTLRTELVAGSAATAMAAIGLFTLLALSGRFSSGFAVCAGVAAVAVSIYGFHLNAGAHLLLLAVPGGMTIGAAVSRWVRDPYFHRVGMELGSAFLVSAGAVGVVGGISGLLPTSLAFSLLLLGWALQYFIDDQATGGGWWPLASSCAVLVAGLWLARGLEIAMPASSLQHAVLVLSLVLSPLAAWIVARRTVRQVPRFEPSSAAQQATPSRRSNQRRHAERADVVEPYRDAQTLPAGFEAASLNALAQVTSHGMAVVDADGRFVLFNEPLWRLYGFSEQPFLGHASAERMALHNAQTGANVPWARHPLALALAGEATAPQHFAFERGDAEGVRTALIQARPIVQSAGTVVGAVLHAEDVTEAHAREARLNEQARRLEQSTGELQRVAFVAAHHLQEPLRGVTSYAQLLERRLGDDEESGEFVQFLSTEAKRVKSLTLDLLAYLEAPTIALECAAVDLNDVLADAAATVRKQYAAEPHEIELTVLKDDLPQVLANRKALHAVLAAVLDNAVKFSEDAFTTVQVSMLAPTASAERSHGRCVIRVSDDGIGLPKDPASRDKLFELFAQHHTIGTYPGNGVGLAMARKLMLAQKGDIRFAAEQPARGAAVEIHLSPAT